MYVDTRMKGGLFMRKLLAILLMALCMTGVAFAEEAEVFTEGDFSYVLTDEGAVITDYAFPDGVMERLTIPETLGGTPVVGIAESALWHEYIVHIVELPATIAMLPEGEFGYGTEIVLHPDNPHFTNKDGFLIDARTNTLLHASPSAAEKPLPAVTRLGNECLKNWHAEGHIILPDTLTSIGAGVFYDCVDVTGVTIPAGVTEIGAGAFNCTSLTEIQLPPGLASIPYLMLSCNDITEITIPESVKYISEWAFYLCPLTRVEIPAGCEFIEYEAFDPNVELVLLGENTHLETLEEYAARTEQHWLTDHADE